MGHYYTLGAELPDLKMDQGSLAYSSMQMKEMMMERFSERDKKQLQLLFLEEDNRILMRLLKGQPVEEEHQVPMTLGVKTLQKMIEEIEKYIQEDPEEDEYHRLKEALPSYLFEFAENYLRGAYKESDRFAEDILQVAYYNYLQKRANGFLKEWFDLNRDIANILAAQTAKKFDLDIERFILGDAPLADILKMSSWGDLASLDNNDAIQEVLKIAEEPSLQKKEKRLDAFRWHYLEEKTFADVFSLDAMVTYYLQTRIIERWTMLDREQGEAAFREMIHNLNRDGKQQLADFVERTKK